MTVQTVSEAEKAFPIGAKVKFSLSMSNKKDFHEGIVSSKPRVVNGKIAVSLDGYVGAFWVNHLELSE